MDILIAIGFVVLLVIFLANVNKITERLLNILDVFVRNPDGNRIASTESKGRNLEE
jgi:hypothetical protein